MAITLSDEEFKALSKVVREYAREHREDVMGAFIMTGGGTVLGHEGVVLLAVKVENSND